jgi:hypothetical protein
MNLILHTMGGRIKDERIEMMSLQRIAIVSSLSQEGSEYFMNLVNEMRAEETPVKEATVEDMKNMGFEVRNG